MGGFTFRLGAELVVVVDGGPFHVLVGQSNPLSEVLLGVVWLTLVDGGPFHVLIGQSNPLNEVLFGKVGGDRALSVGPWK